MNIYDNVIVRLCIFSTIYIVILIFIAPLIDHAFTSLEEDINKKEGDVSIDKMPKKNKSKSDKLGDYVDYEEID